MALLSKYQQRLTIEALEDRQVMTASLAMTADFGALPVPIPQPEISYGGEFDSYAIVASEGRTYSVEPSLVAWPTRR